jgi:hypothetical protein
MEEYTTYEVTLIATKDKWIFQYRKSDGILHCFLNLKGSGFSNLLRKQTFPENIAMIEAWSKFKKIVTIELKLDDYKFNSLWDKYNLKQKREQSEKAFNSLDFVDKIKCFSKLASYDAYLARTKINKALLVTWINQKRFNDEF